MKALTIGEVAKVLGVDPKTVRNYVAQGILPAPKNLRPEGKKPTHRWLSTDIEAWLLSL